MSFVANVPEDITAMMQSLSWQNEKEIFQDMPQDVPAYKADALPAALSEQGMTQLMQQRASGQVTTKTLLGAGAYDHFIPQAVWDLVQRGEFLTAYTPYQAEASQGSLQLFYEYQSMMAQLTGMEVSNASLYDGATSVAEAVLMALRIKRNKQAVVAVPRTLHPRYRDVLCTLLQGQDVTLKEIDFQQDKGVSVFADWEKAGSDNLAAVIIPYPNFFGGIEAIDEVTNWAHQHKALVIAQVNPLFLFTAKEPGKWGEKGADIVCGEGQPLGVPLSYGGPYFGFMCTRKEYIRQLPGRIVGKTKDKQGREAYCLTLQTREQHIRRDKATSNICTNQGLLVIAATIHMAVMGSHGLQNAAMTSHHRLKQLTGSLQDKLNIQPVFSGWHFHENVYALGDYHALSGALRPLGWGLGYDLSLDYPELSGCVLLCTTEKLLAGDCEAFVECLAAVNNQKEVTHVDS